jgi:hypothetical protein
MSTPARKSFQQYLDGDAETECLSEGLFNKGFAIAQQMRFNSNKTTLKSLLSKVHYELNEVLHTDNTSDKIDRLAKGLLAVGDALQVQAELLNNIINVTVVDAVLTDDVEAAVKKALNQRR